MARDLFWMLSLLGVMTVVTVNGLSHSAAWHDARFAPSAPTTPPAATADAGDSAEPVQHADRQTDTAILTQLPG